MGALINIAAYLHWLHESGTTDQRYQLALATADNVNLHQVIPASPFDAIVSVGLEVRQGMLVDILLLGGEPPESLRRNTLQRCRQALQGGYSILDSRDADWAREDGFLTPVL
jgi:hypothetical protein